jgi:tRNA (adenine58-N1)-methyltransferase non-catalytic subunit
VTSTVSLGKYGSFPCNLIIERPYHHTYEVLDKRPDESFSRLRIVPASELHADVLAEEDAADSTATPDDSDRIISATDGVEYSLVDEESGNVVARSNMEVLDESARQTLTMEEIEELKREGKDAGLDIIKKLIASHTGITLKTTFSLAKYKLLKVKKYLRRFQLLPLDISLFGNWQLEDRDGSRILDLREEMLGLVGCWANVHFGGEERFMVDPQATSEDAADAIPSLQPELQSGRWLVVDDVGGLLVGAMAERMGILHGTTGDASAHEPTGRVTAHPEAPAADASHEAKEGADGEYAMEDNTNGASASLSQSAQKKPRAPRASDFYIPYSQTNTLTVLHTAAQPNLSFLNYFGFDASDPNHPPHPLVNHLLSLSWLQLVHPNLDTTYSTPPPTATLQELEKWKPGRRGQFHRKRRRYARTRHTVDSTRTGNFDGLVCASLMDPISILRHTLPLLAGGAPVAIYSPSIEPLAQLADCFSVSRRSAWMSNPPPEVACKSVEELESWSGSEDFPVNPTLLLGVSIQTSRARSWQVLPSRTHPVMTSRGGAEGYIFTAWRSKPAAGKVSARGKFSHKRRRVDVASAPDSEASETPVPAS